MKLQEMLIFCDKFFRLMMFWLIADVFVCFLDLRFAQIDERTLLDQVRQDRDVSVTGGVRDRRTRLVVRFVDGQAAVLEKFDHLEVSPAHRRS